MPSYSVYGSRDDRVAKDGDIGFVGFNNRLRPDQLAQGMLADAQNIRLDRNNEAQVRKGVELISAPIATGASALTLPFTLPTAGQIGDGTTAILDDDSVNAIYGSCAFSDPNAASPRGRSPLLYAGDDPRIRFGAAGGIRKFSICSSAPSHIFHLPS